MFMQIASVKKLLFYIEPAEFRGNRLLLHPCTTSATLPH